MLSTQERHGVRTSAEHSESVPLAAYETPQANGERGNTTVRLIHGVSCVGGWPYGVTASVHPIYLLYTVQYVRILGVHSLLIPSARVVIV